LAPDCEPNSVTTKNSILHFVLEFNVINLDPIKLMQWFSVYIHVCVIGYSIYDWCIWVTVTILLYIICVLRSLFNVCLGFDYESDKPKLNVRFWMARILSETNSAGTWTRDLVLIRQACYLSGYLTRTDKCVWCVCFSNWALSLSAENINH